MTLIRRLVAKRNLAQLDAFGKVDDSFTKTTLTGGTVSVLSYVLIFILITFEVIYYTSSRVKFLYKVDTDFDSKLRLNIDITVAMPCDTIGADIMDSTNQNNAFTYGKLEEEPTYFDLTPNQLVQWNVIREVNNYLRQQHHAVQEILWKTDLKTHAKFGRDIPPAEVIRRHPPDACRLYGTLVVNKVSGNFHITVGKHLPMPFGHAHISLFTSERDYNFSHRIERFSFGEYVPSIINPLEGEEKIATSQTHLFQYYVKVVSTDVKTSAVKMKTFQYSTTERDRQINHASGSHGMPGIYFKYEIDAIFVEVVEEDVSFWRFLVRLCGIVGGIYATSGFINVIANAIVDIVSCKYLKNIRETSQHQVDASGFHTIEEFAVPSDNVSLLYSKQTQNGNANF